MGTLFGLLALLGVAYLIYARVYIDRRPALKRPIGGATGPHNGGSGGATPE